MGHSHSGDDDLGPRTALRQRRGQETHYLIWTGVTHAPSFESDGQLAGAVAQMLGSYSPGSVLWPCDFSQGAMEIQRLLWGWARSTLSLLDHP